MLNKLSGALFQKMNSYYLKFLLYFCPISTTWNIQANENVNRFFSLLTYKALERITRNFTAVFLCPPTKKPSLCLITSIQNPWHAHCDPSPCMTASTQNSWLAHSGAPEQMLSHLLWCVLGCADDLPLHCSVNTLPTLRTPFCFHSSLRKVKRCCVPAPASCLLLPQDITL